MGIHLVEDYSWYLDQTSVILGLVKEGIIEIVDEHLGAICTMVMAIIKAYTLSFCELEIDLEHLGKSGGRIRCRQGRVLGRDPQLRIND